MGGEGCTLALNIRSYTDYIYLHKKVDNVIPTQESYIALGFHGYTLWAGVIKTAGNIRIYCPRVFRLMYGPNQSYSTEYGWECLSPSSKWR